LVLTDQSFVDPDKIDKIEVSHSFRGRDLSEAVLNRVDLRKADFTGAMLNGASLDDANLQNARFGCASRAIIKEDEHAGGWLDEDARRWPGDGCTWMQAASLRRAFLQGVRLGRSRIEGDKGEFVLTIAQREAGPILHKLAVGPILHGAVLAE